MDEKTMERLNEKMQEMIRQLNNLSYRARTSIFYSTKFNKRIKEIIDRLNNLSYCVMLVIFFYPKSNSLKLDNLGKLSTKINVLSQGKKDELEKIFEKADQIKKITLSEKKDLFKQISKILTECETEATVLEKEFGN